MARFDRNKCIENTGGQFDLIMMATKRARELQNGKKPLVDPGDDKPTVVALREIEQGLYTKDDYNKIEIDEEYFDN